MDCTIFNECIQIILTSFKLIHISTCCNSSDLLVLIFNFNFKAIIRDFSVMLCKFPILGAFIKTEFFISHYFIINGMKETNTHKVYHDVAFLQVDTVGIHICLLNVTFVLNNEAINQ
ncbi:hypothetical protein KUTeg_003746 [Tegillarca granosa]|uniref:Uncharacterized protein n=1 Tax=Tegillarca granosa TaxID=220873 RepID=A0ABQ9FQW2_TEGGR|nr:hypothetical protein KUTeg_003746 [Tegillarca granosa]